MTRQELYGPYPPIVKDEVILEEMIRLGFWPTKTRRRLPRRRSARAQRRCVKSANCSVKTPRSAIPSELLKEMHKRRKAEAMREAGDQAPQRRGAQARLLPGTPPQARCLYLGEDVSRGLHTARPPCRYATGLPPACRCQARLKRWAYAGRACASSPSTGSGGLGQPYQRFTIPKKSGGER